MRTNHDLKSFVVAVVRNYPSGARVLGTGFFIGNGLIATTKHVTNGDERDLCITLPKYSINEYQDTSDSTANFMGVKIKAIDPIKDICILEIDGEVNVPYTLSSTDDINIGDSVFVYGYPHADQGRFVLTQQITHVGAKIIIESHGIKTKHIVLNTQARPGQSGGPIYHASGNSIVGMLIGSYAPGGGGGISLGGVDPHTLHQTTHVISAAYIKEMII